MTVQTNVAAAFLRLVDALNTVHGISTANTSKIGTLANLTTSAKSNLVLAVNELKSAIDAVSAIANTADSEIGTLSGLTTADKSTLVAALNELKSGLNAVSGAAFIDDGLTGTTTTWSSTKISSQVNAAVAALINGAGTDSDTLKELADKIVALVQADNGLVSATQVQSFTTLEKKQAAENIGIGDPEYDYVPAIAAALNAGL